MVENIPVINPFFHPTFKQYLGLSRRKNLGIRNFHLIHLNIYRSKLRKDNKRAVRPYGTAKQLLSSIQKLSLEILEIC